MRKRATIRTVQETRPIKDADMIELAVGDGWKCVTKKGVYDIEASAYLEKSELETICHQLELPMVPPLGEMTVPNSLDTMLQQAEGKSLLNPKTEREGLVWVHGSGDDRISFKTISNKFLAKHGD